MASRALTFLSLIALTAPADAVVGGRPVAPGETPWIAAIINTAKPVSETCRDSGGSNAFCQQICGGTLISPDWVLTAAHCLININHEDLRILLGTENLNIDGVEDNYIAVSEAIAHPDAPTATGSTVFSNDIALLRLATPAVGERASIIGASALEELELASPAQDDGATLLGWGRLGVEGAFPAKLQRVSLEMSPSACAASYAFVWDPTLWICSVELSAQAIEADDAGDGTPFDADGEGACVLDSGGPLLAGDMASRSIMGIVSWGQQGDCGNPAFPTVYTRLPGYLDWLESVTATAGSPLTDIGVAIAGARTVLATETPEVVITLANNSITTALTAPSFTIRYEGTAALALTSTSQLSCAPVTGGWDCLYVGAPNMPAESTASASLTASATGVEQTLRINAELVAHDDAADYRHNNDSASHDVFFTGLPDIKLTAAGITEDGTGIGHGWILATVWNSSTHADATATSLSATLPSGSILTSATIYPDEMPLACSGTETISCALGDLSAGSSTTVRLALSSAKRRDGDAMLSAGATEGDFPTTTNALPDASRVVSLVWAEPQENPAPRPTPEPSPPATTNGGGAWLPGILLTLLLLTGRRRRH